MFWRTRRTKNPRAYGRAKLLRVESLESRKMLSGVVQVITDGCGNLTLLGNCSQHYVEITSTPGGGLDQYTITSKDGTLFQINGAGPFTSVQIPSITGNICVNLGQGGPNTFDFEAPSTAPGSVSTVLGNLTIINSSVETNKINNVLIQGNLTVFGCSNGYHEFDAIGTQVNGVTLIDNFDPPTTSSIPCGFCGDSYTDIINCTFEGLNVKSSQSDPPALTIDNGVGNNQVWIQGETPVLPSAGGTQTTSLSTTQIGYFTSACPSPAWNALVITNGDGSTFCNFGGGSNVTLTDGGVATSMPVVYGGVQICNAQVLDLQSNQVSFVGTDVYGGVNITNFCGDTSTSVQQSSLGQQLQNNAPVQVVNLGVGANQFLMTGSEIPWGLAIVNSCPSYGNETIIDSSYIGQESNGAHPQTAPCFSVCGPQPGDVAYISGSSDGVGGPDTVVVRNGTVINGGLDLQLGAGDKYVALDSSTMSCFDLCTGTGNDQLWIGGTTIQDTMNVNLGSGNDTVWLQVGDTNGAPNSLPGAIGGSASIQRGPFATGVSYLFWDVPADAPTFGLPADFVVQQQTDTIPAWALVPSV